MVDVLASFADSLNNDQGPSYTRRLQCLFIAGGFHLYRRLKPKLPGSHNRPEFQRHRYPVISFETLQEKVDRLQRILSDTTRLKIEKLSDVLFRISV
jgi:hypothetical protein